MSEAKLSSSVISNVELNEISINYEKSQVLNIGNLFNASLKSSKISKELLELETSLVQNLQKSTGICGSMHVKQCFKDLFYQTGKLRKLR